MAFSGILGAFIALHLQIVSADLPVHCLRHQVAGEWEFTMGPLGDKRSSCGHKKPDAQYEQPPMNFLEGNFEKAKISKRKMTLGDPNTVSGEDGSTGHWTMIYDEGFEVDIGELSFFAFSRFDFEGGDRSKNISHCDQTQIGWYHDVARKRWGCYFGRKTTASDPSAAAEPQADDTDNSPTDPPLVVPASDSTPDLSSSDGGSTDTVTAPPAVSSPDTTQPAVALTQADTTSPDVASPSVASADSATTTMAPPAVFSQADYSSQAMDVVTQYASSTDAPSVDTTTSQTPDQSQSDTATSQTPDQSQSFLSMSSQPYQASADSSGPSSDSPGPSADAPAPSPSNDPYATASDDGSDQATTSAPAQDNDNPNAGVVDNQMDASTTTGFDQQISMTQEDQDTTTAAAMEGDSIAQTPAEYQAWVPGSGGYDKPMPDTWQESVAEALNFLQLGWKATAYHKFRGKTPRQLNRFAGVRRHRPKTHRHHPFRKQERPPAAFQSFLGVGRSVRHTGPADFDWGRKDGQNFLDGVVSQGDCGSCYTISTVHMLTARNRIKKNSLSEPSFSISFPLYCSEYNQGCDGGYGFLQSKWSEDVGLVPKDCLPFSTGGGSCSVTSDCQMGDKRYRATNHHYVGGYYGGAEAELIRQELVQNGPVVMSFEPKEDFMYYKNGVYRSAPEKIHQEWEQVDHAVLLTGYGEDSKQQFWRMQNSWGTDWGEDGYFRMARGSDESGCESIVVAAEVVEEDSNTVLDDFISALNA